MILTSNQILDEQLVVGDHYKLTYRSGFPIFKSFQAQLVANRLKETETRIGNIQARAEGDLLVVEFDVVKNPFPLVAVLSVIGGVLVSLFFVNLSLERVEKISRSPFGTAVIIGVGLLAVFVLYRLVKGGRT